MSKAVLTIVLTSVLLFSSAPLHTVKASAPGNHGGTVATNNFGPNDLGNTDKVRKHSAYKKLPEAERNYYEHGQPDFNHDGVGGHDTNGNGVKDGAEANHDRGDLASFCARYNRGAAPDANVPAAPTTLAQFMALMEKIKRCVDDLLEEDKDPQPGVAFVTDQNITDFINAGELGIGNPMSQAEFKGRGFVRSDLPAPNNGASGFVCIDHALVFASIVRELGFPVRQVNVPMSKIQGGMRRYTYQEAVTEVWFDGAWHYFDAYLTGGAAQTSPDGLLGGSFTDRKVFVTTTGTDDYDYRPDGDPVPGSGWKKAEGTDKNPKFDYEKVASAATFEQTQPGVRLFVTVASTGLITGWTPDLPGDPMVPESLKDLFLQPELTGARVEIAKSGYLPHGVAQFDSQKPSEDALPSSFTIETVVSNDPEEDIYCVTVWDRTGQGADFEVLISAEDGVRIAMPSTITGHLDPGEIRELVCGEIIPPGTYSLSGGGKFLANSAVSVLRLDLSGAAASDDPNSFSDSVDIGGSLRAFNYLTRTLIESVSFSSLQGTLLGGGDLMAMGEGTAIVNGVPTNIDFDAAKTGGVITFEVRNADTGALLAGGTGEPGRAALELTITP